MDYLNNIWNFKIQIIPMVILLSIYILPNEIRKYKNLDYAPIYFAVPPFCHSNILINRYYEFTSPNNETSSEDKNKLMNKIKKSAGISLLLEVCIWPILFGIISGFIISNNTLRQLIIIILLIRIYQFTKSVFYFRKEQYYSKASCIILIFIYIGFTYISLDYIYNSYNWISNLVAKKEYISIFKSINKFLLKDLLLSSAFIYIGKASIKSFLNKKGFENANLYYIQNAHTKDDNKNNRINR